MVPVLCAAADGMPKCLARDPSDTVEYVAAKAKFSPAELLARLVYAEALSTGIGDDPLVHEAIAWGVMNRVRLAERSESAKRSYGSGIRGVVFKKGQFNPAVSPRSPFSKDFLCPKERALWQMALRRRQGHGRREESSSKPPGEEKRPFAGRQLLLPRVHPGRRHPYAPWKGGGGLEFIGDIMIGDKMLPAEHVRFYRLARPPADLRPAR